MSAAEAAPPQEKPDPNYHPYGNSADGSGLGYSASYDGEEQSLYERYTGLKGVYYNPYTQVALLDFVCSMCPGLFNALQGLGGGGQLDTETSANANSTLYATFAVAAFFAGCVSRPRRGMSARALAPCASSFPLPY